MGGGEEGGGARMNDGGLGKRSGGERLHGAVTYRKREMMCEKQMEREKNVREGRKGKREKICMSCLADLAGEITGGKERD